MPFGNTRSASTRFPGGITNLSPISPMGKLETMGPLHQLFLGWDYGFPPGIPTGNTPATNADWTVTSVTSSGTASFNAAAVYPPVHLLTTGTTASDQVFFQDKRLLITNILARRQTLVAGSFQITSTVANSALAIGLFSGTSVASLGNDQFGFSSSGATLNFVNRNNGGTALTTAISTSLTINTLYGVAAVLDPFKSTVAIWFGTINTFDLKNTATQPQELPATNTIAVSTSNIPDGTNSVQFAFGAQTSAGAAATVQFGPCFAMVV